MKGTMWPRKIRKRKNGDNITAIGKKDNMTQFQKKGWYDHQLCVCNLFGKDESREKTSACPIENFLCTFGVGLLIRLGQIENTSGNKQVLKRTPSYQGKTIGIAKRKCLSVKIITTNVQKASQGVFLKCCIFKGVRVGRVSVCSFNWVNLDRGPSLRSFWEIQ